MIIYVLRNLINGMGFLIIVAYFISRIGMFKRLVTKRNSKLSDKIIMSIIFGGMGILATCTGTAVNGAIVNSRIIGVLVGGIFGGPIVGIGAGLIAGIHRWAIDIGGFTSIACAISTITEGVIGGILSRHVRNHKYNWIYAFFIGAFSEILQMLIVLLVARPFGEAVQLVKIIWIPMVVFNPIGIALFVALIDSIYKEQEKEAAIQTQLALDIAEKCLVYLRKGLSDVAAIKCVTKIIMEMSDVSAVSITNTKNVLAHVGAGEDHHVQDMPILTSRTIEVINTGQLSIAQSKAEIGCMVESCRLKSAVIVPLTKKNEVIGTIKIYRTRENGISDVDIRLAVGLAKLFSTQLELSDIDCQIKMREKAELKALQSQINPHFLFNTLNTIVSFCRIQPEKARELLIDLSTHLRNTLEFNKDFVCFQTELKHVNAYVSIEKARFEEKLQVEMDIDKDIDCLLPQLILQPIVENAIKHGLLPKKEGGILKITAKKADEETVISIEDSGIGIDESIIKQLYSDKMADNKIGVSNVYNRLRCIYGNDNCFSITNRDSGGTKVQIRIPSGTAGDF